MVGHLNVLAESIISNPAVKISDLEILTPAEKHRLLVEWNDTTVDYPKDKCIHQLFEQQVEKTPANVAVVFEKKELTYRELNEKANQLGRYLQNKGVKPETLVGICIERSLDMIVGLLGILKAGGAYVPIDPTYPEERITYMLEDTDCEIVLAQEHLKLPKTNSKTINLDADWDKIENEPAENVKSEVKSDNLAYVIYTSGSTGKPKGVMIEHKNTVSMLEWAKNIYNTNEIKGILASTSINFDLSIYELFLPLTTGNTIILVDNILSFNDSINRDKVSLINTVPSAIKQLFDEKLISDSVKVINLAGEKLKQQVVENLYLLKPSLKVIDLYGPSEDTTYSTYSLRRVNGFDTIGRPVSNTQIYITDKNLNIVPIGIAGELCISGYGLARGYLKRSELTSEKFIKNPFSNDPNSRLYKTGDLVRYLPDGNIEFLGRIDNQVKIRGFRVELGEIESALNKIETIKDCVVVAKEDASGDKRLIAYIVLGDELNIQEIRESLSKSLPDYMVPALFVILEKMPLTPNGKIDRKAFPYPEDNIATTNEYVAPRNKTEQIFADIWSKVLGIEKIGVYDNFFELGGHSLLLTVIQSKINDDLLIQIPIKILFEYSNIDKLFKYLQLVDFRFINANQFLNTEEEVEYEI
jgi:amino acid adenylation domain-containing protein